MSTLTQDMITILMSTLLTAGGHYTVECMHAQCQVPLSCLLAIDTQNNILVNNETAPQEHELFPHVAQISSKMAEYCLQSCHL